jgi:hypothetical protein
MYKQTLRAGAIIAVLGASAVAFAQTAAAAEAKSPHSLTANVGLFSQYIFRGLTQTNRDPAVQGGFDYAYETGGPTVYVGTWASNISWLTDGGQYSSSSLENDWYGELARPRHLAAALAMCSPAVGATIDTGHLIFLGCDLAAAARLLGGRTFHVHLKVVRRPSAAARVLARLRRRHSLEPALPGCDDGLDSFVSVMRASGYDGMLAVEHEGQDDLASALACYRRRAASLVGGGAPLGIAEAAGA